ncbi:hypothetical protein [Streptomyces sp. SPB162]|uniref:hypothetical protein n=1 Tax=Streptomyces sp. SPB162 TaxID=2940560 RepID=UPI002406D052|nr:hypothetical protein [Streptomyces sp. SPB162]MDF9813833.1 hypothetical protein [Streptomyces sp. SPB162]
MSHSTPDDDRITLTPISRPDPEAREGRRRRRIIGGTIALVVLAGGGIGWAVAANGEDDKPVKHTAVLPESFGAYTLAQPDDTEWTRLSSVNTDITKGSVDLTYRAAGGKALLVTVELDPPVVFELGESDDALSAMLDAKVESSQVKKYPAGDVGGDIQCVDMATQRTAFTQCLWQDATAHITLAPVLNHHTVVAKDAPADLRAFLGALKIQPK